jgi:calcineurin-like phosphoesterase family protein
LKTRIFLTADEHYIHYNIIHHCSRPWKTLQAMHAALIKRHNNLVGENDLVFHIGDFAFADSQDYLKVRKLFKQLNGRHHLILGNHDEIKPFNYVKMGFITVHTALWQTWGDINFVLAHDPAVYTAMDDGVLLCGHIHKLWRTIPEHHGKLQVINVGVDVWDYYPVLLDDIIDLVNKRAAE